MLEIFLDQEKIYEFVRKMQAARKVRHKSKVFFRKSVEMAYWFLSGMEEIFQRSSRRQKIGIVEPVPPEI